MTTNAPPGTAPDHFPWDQLIPIFPQLLALGLLLLILLIIGRRRLFRLAARITKVKFLGIEVEIAADIERAASRQGVDVSRKDAKLAARQLADAADLLSCTRLLWVDDEPDGNVNEMRLLRRLCVQIDLAESTEAGRRALRSGIYDLVISDMGRASGSDAGLETLGDVMKTPLRPEIIFYVREMRHLPDGAFGMTNRPDRLFELIIAAVEKRKRATPSVEA